MCMIFSLSFDRSDAYTSLKLVRRNYLHAKIRLVNEKKKKTADDNAMLKKLQDELVPIEKFLDEARQHRDAISSEIASLQFDNEKCVIMVDFTKWGLVVNGNVHCFVMCVLFGEKKLPGMLFPIELE